MSEIDLDQYYGMLGEAEDPETAASREYQETLFLKYVVRNEGFAECRAALMQAYHEGTPLAGPDGLRRKLGAIDLEYFGRAYLAHYFTNPSPPFHNELDEIWRNGVMKGLNPMESAEEISRAAGCRRAIEAPRGHAKSTTFTFKDSIHAAVYAYKHYEIILSDSSEQAEGGHQDGAGRKCAVAGRFRRPAGPCVEIVGNPAVQWVEDRGNWFRKENPGPPP